MTGGRNAPGWRCRPQRPDWESSKCSRWVRRGFGRWNRRRAAAQEVAGRGRIPGGAVTDMGDDAFSTIAAVCQSRGPGAAIEDLIRELEARKDFHRLFDAL